MNNLPRILEKLLKQCIEKEASDLHLSAESLPILRIHGRLTMLQGNILSSDVLEETARAIMNERQLKVFEEEQSLDMAFSLNGGEQTDFISGWQGLTLSFYTLIFTFTLCRCP